MPGDNRFGFDDDQDAAPCRLESAKQNPKHSISHSQSWARIFSLEDTQLLTQSKDLKTEVVARAEEHAEIGEEAGKKWNHKPGFIS